MRTNLLVRLGPRRDGTRLAVACALAVLVSVVVFPGVAAPSGPLRRTVSLRHEVGRVRGYGMNLSQAPVALREAVRTTLGPRAAGPGSAFQQRKLTAADGASGDEFGYSVAVSGQTAVVGAYLRQSETGAAYVFVRSGTSWALQKQLTAPDAAEKDQFGWSVALSGSTALVGAPGKNSSTGAAYVFVRSGTKWSQQQELTATDGTSNDSFGDSVALSGQTAVIGAEGKSLYHGAAYVFVRSGMSWAMQQELTDPAATKDDDFGLSVAVSGQTAVIGANGNNSNTGAAYVFVRSLTTWSQQQELTATDAATGDNFGYSVALAGQTAVVGAPFKNTQTGAAYVFVRSGTSWTQQQELTASDKATADLFGVRVAISGPTAVVGADGKNSGAGAAYVFAPSGTSWTQETELKASDATASGNFGDAVAIDGSTVVVGAPFKNGSKGAAYVFVVPYQQAKLTASSGAAGDNFGWSVALSGQTALVGAPGTDSNRGAAYIFVRSGTKWILQKRLIASDAVNNNYFGFSLALSGQTAVIGAIGDNSGRGAAYVFVRSGTKWSQQKKLIASGAAKNDFFGYSVAISGETVVVGTPKKNSNRGAAYVFVRSGAKWSEQKKLTDPAAANNDEFGFSVAVAGQTAVIGAIGNNAGRGAAYVFVRSGTQWSQQKKLTAADAAANDNLGWSVAIYSSTVVVGAPNNSSTGAAYVFVRSGTKWSQQKKLAASDAAAADQFGASVALSGQTAVIGAYNKNSATGVAYVFVRSGTAWPQQAELTATDAAFNDHFGYSVAVSGPTAVIGAYNENSGAGAAYTFGNV